MYIMQMNKMFHKENVEAVMNSSVDVLQMFVQHSDDVL